MGIFCQKRMTKNSQQTPRVTFQGFPQVFGHPLGAGCVDPGSLNGSASNDGAFGAMHDADAAIVGNIPSCPPITLPWLDTLSLSLAGTLPPSAFPPVPLGLSTSSGSVESVGNLPMWRSHSRPFIHPSFNPPSLPSPFHLPAIRQPNWHLGYNDPFYTLPGDSRQWGVAQGAW